MGGGQPALPTSAFPKRAQKAAEALAESKPFGHMQMFKGVALSTSMDNQEKLQRQTSRPIQSWMVLPIHSVFRSNRVFPLGLSKFIQTSVPYMYIYIYIIYLFSWLGELDLIWRPSISFFQVASWLPCPSGLLIQRHLGL